MLIQTDYSVRPNMEEFAVMKYKNEKTTEIFSVTKTTVHD